MQVQRSDHEATILVSGFPMSCGLRDGIKNLSWRKDVKDCLSIGLKLSYISFLFGVMQKLRTDPPIKRLHSQRCEVTKQYPSAQNLTKETSKKAAMGKCGKVTDQYYLWSTKNKDKIFRQGNLGKHRPVTHKVENSNLRKRLEEQWHLRSVAETKPKNRSEFFTLSGFRTASLMQRFRAGLPKRALCLMTTQLKRLLITLYFPL